MGRPNEGARREEEWEPGVCLSTDLMMMHCDCIVSIVLMSDEMRETVAWYSIGIYTHQMHSRLRDDL